jgi:hypothetical protein
MAEIRVERKQGAGKWLWILLLVIVLIALAVTYGTAATSISARPRQ